MRLLDRPGAPLLLDLYCGAGGAAMGYSRAGFNVVGVDHVAQPRYPFRFHRLDALAYLAGLVACIERGVDGRYGEALRIEAIHASPPCQAYSIGTKRWAGRAEAHADLVGPTRELLEATGLPYLIENVVGAPLRAPVRLCGSSFGLDLERHRLFETSFPVLVPSCAHGWQRPRFPPNRSGRRGKLARVISVAGHGAPRLDPAEGGGKAPVAEWRRVMEVDWMTRAELAEAVPPAYTELLGLQLFDHLRTAASV